MKFDFEKQPGKIRTRFYSPDPKNALVSVITAYYNAGKYFEQTFNSVMNQTFPWFEWIIVNDGSTNQEDIEILNKFAAMDSRITVITQENGGLSCARNTCIHNTHTDLIVPLDADDLIAPTYLECLYWAMYYNPDAAWCYTSNYGFHDQEYIWRYPFSAEKLKSENFLNYTAMIRKKDILDVGGYKGEKWSYYEEWRFWLDMLSLSKKPVHIDTCLFWYRRLESGMLSTINKDPERVKFCKDIIQKAGETANTNIQAQEYPVLCTKYPFYTPKKLTWNRRSSETHAKHRVMWIISWMMMGGADKFNLDAIAGLKENGFDSYILTTNLSDNEWRQKFEDYTDEIFCLPDFLDPSHYLEFISYYIQSRDIDTIMLTNSYVGYYMLPWIRQHFPEVVIVDYVHMEEWNWLGGGYARTSGALSGIVEKTYVCNSKTQKVISEKFNRGDGSVECLYIGVDHHYFSREKEEPDYLHNLLNLPKERKIVLFPCRVHEQKRPFLMLEIAERVKAQNPEIAFVVAGDGPQLEELQKAIQLRKLDETVFCIGVTDKMRACYRDSELTLICSRNEGLSLTAYESLSMGIPVVSSDVGGQRDLIGSDVGALIPFMQNATDEDNRNFCDEEINAFAEQIVNILQKRELYSQLSINCRRKIEERFSIDKMVERLSEEIEYLANDAQRMENRHAISQALNQMGNIAADYYTIYRQWEIKNQEYLKVLGDRCYFADEWRKERDLSFLSLVRKLLSKIKRKVLSIFTKQSEIA